MRRLSLALTLFAATSIPALAAAQSAPAPAGAPAPAPAQFPETPFGRLAARFVDAINSGDSATAVRFAAEHLGRDPRGRSPEALARLLVKIQQQSGGFKVERAGMAGGAVRMTVESRRGGSWLGMELEPATGDTTKIASLMTMPLPPHGMHLPPAAWSTDSTLGDDAVAAVIRARVKQAVDSDRFSGVVLVAHGDRVLVHDVSGWADRERGVKNTAETPFATASLGKMFTGVAIAQLVADGKLSFDDTLAKVLPEYPNQDAARRVTIRQILTHTAGIPDVFLSGRFKGGHRYASHAEILTTFADAPLNGNAGKSFDYSNGGFATLAAVVERLSGQSFGDYLRQRVFAPAGMRVPCTTPAVGYARWSELDPLGVEPRLPESVRGKKSAKPDTTTAKSAAASKPRECAPVLGFGGNAYTAEDLYRFARALRTGKLIPAALADTITTGKVAMGGPIQYGFGFFVRPLSGSRVIGHSGTNPDTGHDADLEMVWERDWTVVVLSNYDSPAGMQLMFPILELVGRQR